ncbi:MAG: class I SAM-dependent methyltransferase [Candidatus Aminicenantes bacterium]|nr:class I SAM-dependent methyltransferase [Candidatus Aminicenantes bacterium]
MDKALRAERCPVCLGRRFRAFRKGTLEAAALRADQVKITDREYGATWDLSLCLDCRHLFADPYPSPEFLLSLYGRVEDPLYDQEAVGRSRNFESILDRLDKLRPARGELFDVGAATGILGDLARRRGWKVDGIEPSLWAVRRAEAKYGLALRRGDFLEAELPENRYQAVTMVDLIEHTPRPREAVGRAFRILAPGGALVIVTPNIHSLAARAAGRRWWHLRPGHLAYFSSRSLRRLLAEAGFRILSWRRYAWTFSLHYLLSRGRAFAGLLESARFASFLKGVRIKLALGDSFEVYAAKEQDPAR